MSFTIIYRFFKIKISCTSFEFKESKFFVKKTTIDDIATITEKKKISIKTVCYRKFKLLYSLLADLYHPKATIVHSPSNTMY